MFASVTKDSIPTVSHFSFLVCVYLRFLDFAFTFLSFLSLNHISIYKMSNYKVPSFLSVPNYFKANDISLQSLDGYCNQLGEDVKEAPLSTRERMCIDYLNLTKSDENLPRIIKSKIGALVKQHSNVFII